MLYPLHIDCLRGTQISSIVIETTSRSPGRSPRMAIELDPIIGRISFPAPKAPSSNDNNRHHRTGGSNLKSGVYSSRIAPQENHSEVSSDVKEIVNSDKIVFPVGQGVIEIGGESTQKTGLGRKIEKLMPNKAFLGNLFVPSILMRTRKKIMNRWLNPIEGEVKRFKKPTIYPERI